MKISRPASRPTAAPPSPLKRFLRSALTVLALTTVLPMCTELTQPGPNGTIVVTVVTPAVDVVAGAAILTVGDTIRPKVDIKIDGLTATRGRFAVRSIKNNGSVVQIDSGTIITVKDRGSDTLIVSVVGATIDPALSNKTADTIAIIARPASNVVNVLNTTLTALGDSVLLRAVSKGKDGKTPVTSGSVEWSSSDPTVVRVDSLITVGRPDSNVAAAYAVRPGTATITAVFERVDTVRKVINVAQTIDHYVFLQATTQARVTNVNFASIGDTMTVRAIARDKNDSTVANPPAPVFRVISTTTSQVTVDPNSGLVTALANTTDDKGIKIGVTATNDSVFFVVKQVADSIRIRGPRSISLAAIGEPATLTADVFDKRRNPMGNSAVGGNVWRPLNSTIVTVDNENVGDIKAAGVGTTGMTVTRDGKSDTVTVAVSNNPKTVDIVPGTLALKSLTETAQVTARFANSLGAALVGSATWSSLDPAVASVTSGSGPDSVATVTAVATGTARIVGTTVVGSGADTVLVTVTNNPATVLFPITPKVVTIASIGDTLSPQVPVTLKNAKGATLPRNSVTWSSADAAIAITTLDNLGNIVAVAKGQTQVIARSPDGAADTVGVIVTNAPATIVADRDTVNFTSIATAAGSGTLGVSSIQLSAIVKNGRGAPITGQQLTADPVAWRSTDGSVAAVNTSSGLVTALGNGTAKIIAEVGASTTGLRADTVVIQVTNAAANMTLNGPTSITSIGNTAQLTATATNNAGGVISGQTFTWSSSNNSIATVSSTGLVTAVATGVVTITAGVQGTSLTRTLDITITNLPSTINITSADTTLASINDTFTPGVNFRNAANQALSINSASWTSDDPAIVSVNSSGLIKAIAAGTTKIRATNSTNSAITDSIQVTVTNAPASMTLNPGTAQTLTSFGQTVSLTATVKNAAGATIANPNVVWEVVGDSTIVTAVDAGIATGLVTAVANGTRTVRVTAGSVIVNLSVTVAQAVSATQSTVTASPTSITADGTSTSTITVQLKDANGNNIVTAVQPTVTLTRSLGTLSTSTPTSNGSGGYTATLTAGTAIGGATVSATAGSTGISASALVAFTAAAATKYVVTADNFAPAAGATVTISAQLTDANNNPITTAGKVITWSSTGGGSFSSPTSTTLATGIATVTFTTNTTASTHVVTATDNSGPPLTGSSAQIVGTASVADHYVVTPSTTSPAAGASVTLTAQLVDVNGNSVGTANKSVAWTIGGVPIAGSPTLTDATGKATISYTTSTTSGTSVNIQAATAGLTAGSSGAITTVPGAAAKILITGTGTQQPSGTATAGVAFAQQPIVRIVDANNNTVTSDNSTIVTVARSGGTGTLAGTLTATASSGIVTFSGLNHPAASTITLVFSSGSLTTVTSSNIVVSASTTAAASQTTASVPAGTAGTATSFTVTARDANGNPLTVSGGSVVATVTGANTATANVTDNGNGTYTVSYTPTAVGTDAIAITIGGVAISGSPYSTVVGFGALANFLVEASGGGSIASQIAGSAFNVRLTARDANNNTVTSFTGTVQLTSTGTLTGSPVTSAAFVNGVLTSQAVTITNSGSFTLTATGSGKTGTSNSFSVGSGAATQISVSAGQGQTATAGSAVATAPAVLVQDATGNPVSGVTVVFAVATGGGSLSGGTATTNASGIATVGSWTLGTTAGANTMTATSGSLTGSPITFNATGQAGTATKYIVTSSSGSPTAGGNVTINAQLADANNNPVSASRTVTWSSTGGGSFSAGTSGTNGSGLATITFTTNTAAGTAHTVTGNDGSVSGTTSTFATVAGAATKYLVTASTTSPAAGAGVTITAQLADANNNAVSTSGQVVTWSKSDANGSFSAPTSTTNASGIATVTFTSHTVSGTSTTVTGTDGSARTGTTATITTAAGAGTNYLVTTSSASPTAGAGVTITAQLRDANNNNVALSGRVITWTKTNPNGSFSAATSTTNGIGVATVTFTTHTVAGTSADVIATDNTSISGTSPTITTAAGAATKYVVTSTSYSPAAGSTVTINAQLADANNNAVATAGQTVTWSATNGGNFSSATSLTNGSGIATVSFTTNVASGTAHDVTATTGGTSGTASTITTVPGTATKYIVTSSSNGPTVGGSVTITAQLADGNNNAVTTSGKTVTWSSTNGGSFGAPTSSTNSSGVATVTFTVSSTSAVSHVVTATDNTSITGSTTAITTVAAAAANYAVTSSAASPVAGANVTITAQLKDAGGNNVLTAGRTVTWSSTNGGSFGAATSLTDASGVATVTFTTSTTAGTAHTVTGNDGSVQGTSASFTTVAGNATQIAVNGGDAQSATAGSAVTTAPSVIVKDANNNPVAGVSVTFAAATGGGSVTAASQTTNASGIATVGSWTLGTTAGANTMTATSGSLSGSPVTFTATGTVGTASTAKSTISASPTSVTANGTSTSTITVQLKDANNNNLTVSGGVVNLATTAGSLGAVTNNNNGTYTATFTAPSTTGSGSATISGDIGGVAINSANNATITLTPAPATKYIVTVDSTPTVGVGSTLLATAQLADANNNAVKTSGKTVSWSSNINGGSFVSGTNFATPLSTTDANGTAVIAYTVNTGTPADLLRVKATDNTALTGTSAATTLVAGPPSQLVFVTNPAASTAAGASFGAVVEVRDAAGNPVTTDPNGGATETITVALTSAGGATLGGTKTANVNWTTGRATFAGLTVDQISSYTLTAADANFSTNLTDATSTSFTITGTVSLAVTQQGAESGPTAIVYTATLSAPNNTGSAVTINFADAGTGTATSGSDYTAIGGAATISIANGATTGTASVTVIDDALLENTETVTATISSPSFSGVTVGTASATANITESGATANLSTLTNGNEASGTTDIVYRVTLSKQNATGSAVTFNLADSTVTSGGTATAGSDYTAFGGTNSISVANGATTGDFTVDVLNDALLENTETVKVKINTPNLASVTIGTALASANILEEGNVTANLSTLTNGNEASGTTDIVYRVTLSKTNATGSAITFNLADSTATSSGTATAGSDYTAFGGTNTISVADGASTGNFTVDVLNDALLENTETVKVKIDTPSNAAVTIGTALASANILEEGATASIATITNGDEAGATTDIVYRVTLSKTNATGSAVTVNLADSTATSSGTATAGSDYTAFGGTNSVSIANGATTGDFTVDVLNDALLENTETVKVKIDTPSLASVTIGTALASANILEEGGVTANLSTLTNGNEAGPVNIVYRVTLSKTNATGSAITFNLADSTATSSGTATAGSDYTAFGGTNTISVANGQSTGNFTVTVIDDSDLENTETVKVKIDTPSNAAVTIGTPLASANITESGATATLSTVTNGDEAGATTDIVYRVTLNKTNRTGSAITFNLADSTATSSGTATAGSDYTAFGGTNSISVANNQSTSGSTGDFTVDVLNDALLENTETVKAKLDSPSIASVTLGTVLASANILEEGNVTANLSTLTNGNEAGATTDIVYRVTLSKTNATGSAITFNLADSTATSSGTATAGSDYTAFGGTNTISVANGQSTGNFTVDVLNDALLENTETVKVKIDTPSNGAITIGTALASANILEEGATISIATQTNGNEASGTTDIVYRLTLSKTNATGGNVTVNLADSTATSSGTATAGSDYTAFGGTNSVSIADGQSTVDFTVDVLNDALLENTETVKVKIDTPNLASVSIGTALASANILEEGGVTANLATQTNGNENGTISIVYRVTLTKTNATGSAITFNLADSTATSGGTATSGSDYTAFGGNISVADGQSTGDLTVTVTDDGTDEPTETVIAKIDTPSNGAVTIGTALATANLLDNDGDQPVVTTQPSGAANGVDLTTQPVIEIRDGTNAVKTAFSGTVTVSVASTTTGTCTLSGTLTVTVVNGVATFTNLRCTGTATGVVLRFTPSGTFATPFIDASAFNVP